MNPLTTQAKRSLLSLAIMAAFAMPSAYAATLNVTTTADVLNGSDGLCSLREAVMSVNAGANSGDCVAVVTEAYGTNDTINLPAGTYQLTLIGLDETPSTTDSTAVTQNTPNASIGDLDLTASVKIIGAGSGTTSVQWAAGGVDKTVADRVFHIYNTASSGNVDVTIQGVTVANGRAFQEDLGVDPVDASFHWYYRRAGGAIALGEAAKVVKIDTTISGADNAKNSDGGQGGSTGEETTSVTYSLTLSDVVAKDSSAQGDGGGLYIAATTTATNTVVQGNTSTTNGGGFYIEAPATITTSTIANNISEGGGGLFVTGAKPITVTRSTFSGNRAVGGGAVSGRAGITINMDNSTLSGNLAQDVGAGFYHNGQAVLRFVTIANNVTGADSASAGSGINTFPSGSVAVDLRNVLLAGNVRAWVPTDYKTDPFPDTTALTPSNCGGTGMGVQNINSLGNNLSSDTTCTAVLDQVATDKNNVDPKIGALAANGGLTQTHALLTGSPALGAGAAIGGITIDQRGTTRDATPDIGAFEVPTPASSGGGGGGCTVNPGAAFDPGLLALLGAAIGGLFLRRRRQAVVRR